MVLRVVRLKFCKISIFATPGTHAGLHSGRASLSEICKVFYLYMRIDTVKEKRLKFIQFSGNFAQKKQYSVRTVAVKNVLHTTSLRSHAGLEFVEMPFVNLCTLSQTTRGLQFAFGLTFSTCAHMLQRGRNKITMQF